MKLKRKKSGMKLLSFLLTLVMVVGLVPGMSLTAYARDTCPYCHSTDIYEYDEQYYCSNCNNYFKLPLQELCPYCDSPDIEWNDEDQQYCCNNCFEYFTSVKFPPGRIYTGELGKDFFVDDLQIGDILAPGISGSQKFYLVLKENGYYEEEDEIYYDYSTLNINPNEYSFSFETTGTQVGIKFADKVRLPKVYNISEYEYEAVDYWQIIGDGEAEGYRKLILTGYNYTGVEKVSLLPATSSLDVDGVVSLTASFTPENATDKKVVWTVGGTNASAVTLYTDKNCTKGNEVGTDPTETLTVYAKGVSAGSVTVTVASNADSNKSASCELTVSVATAYKSYLVTGDDTSETLPDKVMHFNDSEWYIIADESSAVDAGTVTLFAKDSVGKSKFNENTGDGNAYSGSKIKGAIDALTAESGTFADVTDAIKTVTVITKGYQSEETYDTVTNAKLYLLSTSEAQELPEALRKFSDYWWLRSPGNANGKAACVNGEDGAVRDFGSYVTYEDSIRPALQLDLSKVEFDSSTNTFSVAAPALDPVSYLVWDDDAKELVDKTGDDACKNYTVVTDSITTFENGNWYVVNADVINKKRITVNGTAHLILVDGKTLNANKGIAVADGNTLNIYGQSTGNGALIANSDVSCAGIGGNNNGKGGNVTVYGGTVTANAGTQAAGIGGGHYEDGGTFTIYGGTVTATGGQSTDDDFGGAGIGGGGECGNGGNVNIHGGTVTAIGGGGGAVGIGMGEYGSNNGTLTLGTGVKMLVSADNSNWSAYDGTTRTQYMKTQNHTHSFTYSADGATITATCANTDGNCILPPSTAGGTDHVARLTIEKPTLTTYGQTGTGISANATLTGTETFNDATGLNISADGIKYYKATKSGTTYTKGEEITTGAPTDAGDYLTEITVSAGEPAADYVAAVGYTIAKAAGSISYATEQITRTYGDAAFTNELTNTGDGSVNYSSGNTGVATVNASTGEVTIVGAGTATITATVTDGDNYTYAIKTAGYTLTVNRLNMTVNAGGYTGTYDGNVHGITVNVTEPATGATIKYGTTAAECTQDTSPAITNVNDSPFTVYYKVTAPNYNDATGSATVTLNKAGNPAIVTETAAVTAGGNTVDLSENVTKNGAAGTVSYVISGDAKGCSVDGNGVLTSGSTTGTVTVNVSIAADDNHNALAATPITVTITAKGTQTISANDVSVTYGDTDKSVSATVTDPAAGGGAISYAVKEGSGDYIAVDATTGALTINSVPANGLAYVTATAAETQTYAQAVKDITVTINKAYPVAATVNANNRDYNKQEEPLVTVTGEPTGGKMQYALGNETEATEVYADTIPTAANPGTYYVWYKVKGDGNHSDSKAAYVAVSIVQDHGDVTDEDMPAGGIIPDGIWIAGIRDLKYTGKALKQDYRLYDGNKLLLEKTDYTASYKNNTKAYEAGEIIDPNKAPTLNIRMKGNYREVEPVYFSITRVDIGEDEFRVSDMSTAYTGNKQTPAPVLTWNGKKLRPGTDFTVKEYVENTYDFVGKADGTTVYDLTVKGIGNFTGERKITLTIAGKTEKAGEEKTVPVVLMKDVKTPSIPEQAYTGEEYDLDSLRDNKGNKLAFTVIYKNKNTVLVPGTDYEAEFTDAKEAGTATLILRGLGANDSETGFCFVGEKRITFKIKGLQITGATVNGLAKSYQYTGEAIEPVITLEKDGKAIPEADYTVEYINNVKAGTASVMITGQNSCQGTKKADFKITPYDLSTDKGAIVINGGEAITTEYVKGGAQPGVTVTFGGGKLIEGRDYTVKYSNNKQVAKADAGKKAPTVTVTGKGMFKGSKAVPFTIGLRRFVEGNGFTVLASDITAGSKAGTSKIKVLDSDGREIKAGQDYKKEVKYYNAETEEEINKDTKLTEAGTVVKVEITGMGTYTDDKLTGVFRVIARDNNISKATIRIANQEYTGKEVKITDQKQFVNATIKIDGVTKQLTLGKDFEIVEGTYVRNVKKGTAKVTIHGLKGGEEGLNLGGYKTVTFRIKERSIKEWWEELFDFFG